MPSKYIPKNPKDIREKINDKLKLFERDNDFNFIDSIFKQVKKEFTDTKSSHRFSFELFKILYPVAKPDEETARIPIIPEIINKFIIVDKGKDKYVKEKIKSNKVLKVLKQIENRDNGEDGNTI